MNSNQRAERERKIQALWQTPLGLMFRRYLDPATSSEDASFLQRQITDRILVHRSLRRLRLFAIQIFVEDLYEKGRLAGDSMIRVNMLSNRLTQARIDNEANSIEYFGFWSATLFAASVPFGSPIVREQVGVIASRMKNFLLRRFGREPGARREFAAVNAITRQFFEGYALSKTTETFVNFLGAYSAFYFLRESLHPSQWVQSEISFLRELDKAIDVKEL